MRSAARWLTATAASVALVAATAVPALAETPQRSVALPLTGYSAMAVDPVLGHVFVSSAADDAVAVTDLSGNVVKKIENLPGASGLALSPDGGTMFVGLSQSGAIAALDTLVLAERTRYPVGSVCPRHLAITSDRVWFSHHCEVWQGGVGSVGFNGAEAKPSVLSGLYAAPALATSPARPGLLITGVLGISPSTLTAYRVSGDTLVQQATRQAGENLNDVRFSKDGSLVHVASGSPYVIQSYTSDALANRAEYDTGPYPVAVAISPDTGALAAATQPTLAGDPAVRVYPSGTFPPSRSYEGWGIADGALAWGPAGRWVYAVTVSGISDTDPHLHVMRA